MGVVDDDTPDGIIGSEKSMSESEKGFGSAEY